LNRVRRADSAVLGEAGVLPKKQQKEASKREKSTLKQRYTPSKNSISFSGSSKDDG